MIHSTAQAAQYWTPTSADAPKVPAVAANYWNSVADPQRGWLLEAFALLGGAASALELGCQSGPNLRVLRAVYPRMTLTGLDVNVEALALGRQWFGDAGQTVTLLEGTVPQALEPWADEAVDVVFSVYTLAYQDPEDIAQTLQTCLRIARRALVLIEPMAREDLPFAVLTVDDSAYVEWRHDYVRGLALALMGPEAWPGRLRVLSLDKPAHDRLSGVLIAVKEGLDGQPIR